MLFATGASAAIPQSQRDALIAVYNATGGPSWTDKTNWLGAPGTECTWYGVECDDTQSNVTALLPFANNMSGSLPAAIGQLPNLENLYAGGNALSGNVPPNSAR